MKNWRGLEEKEGVKQDMAGGGGGRASWKFESARNVFDCRRHFQFLTSGLINFAMQAKNTQRLVLQLQKGDQIVLINYTLVQLAVQSFRLHCDGSFLCPCVSLLCSLKAMMFFQTWTISLLGRYARNGRTILAVKGINRLAISRQVSRHTSCIFLGLAHLCCSGSSCFGNIF